MFKDLVYAISNLGFPIFIALYLLIRVENTVKDLTGTIERLSDNLDISDRKN